MLGAFEVMLECLCIPEFHTDREWQARQPKPAALFNEIELSEREISHIAQHQIARLDLGEEVFSDGLVLLGGGVQ